MDKREKDVDDSIQRQSFHRRRRTRDTLFMTGNRIGQENEENSSVGGQKLNPNETKFEIRINSTQDLLSIF